MINYILGAVIIGILFLAIRKLVKDNRQAKENGACSGCIGCPHANSCSSSK